MCNTPTEWGTSFSFLSWILWCLFYPMYHVGLVKQNDETVFVLTLCLLMFISQFFIVIPNLLQSDRLYRNVSPH